MEPAGRLVWSRFSGPANALGACGGLRWATWVDWWTCSSVFGEDYDDYYDYDDGPLSSKDAAWDDTFDSCWEK